MTTSHSLSPALASMQSAMSAAVAAASSVCSTVQARFDQLRAITKDDKSPVTIADFASQAVVARSLRAALGEDLLLVGEESSSFLRDPQHAVHLNATLAVLRDGDNPAWPDITPDSLFHAIDGGDADPLSARAIADGFFTLDPIDGTKGFLRGGQYAVALAFVRDGAPQLAAMGCPNLAPDPTASPETPAPSGSLFCASRAGGCVTQSPLRSSFGRGGSELAISPSSRTAFAGARQHPILAESVESAHSDQSASALIMRELDPAYTLVRLDSQCKYAVVARGQADVYLRLPSKKGYVERIWDHAAGALIAEEAGCIVSDVFGKPLDFSHGRGLEVNKGVVVAPATLYPRIISAIDKHRPRDTV